MGITKSTLFTAEQNDFANKAKALSHPARIAIIEHILKSDTCINSSLVEELGLAQATISQHLKELKQIGIIQGSIEGKSMNYCINEMKWIEFKNHFNNLFNKYTCSDDGCC